MTDVTDRLRKASDECIKSYESWQGDKTNTDVRETLVESVHELRKAAARLEIELAISERDLKKSKPIPIPPHRSSRSKGKSNNGKNGKGKSGKGKSGKSSKGGSKNGKGNKSSGRSRKKGS